MSGLNGWSNVRVNDNAKMCYAFQQHAAGAMTACVCSSTIVMAVGPVEEHEVVR